MIIQIGTEVDESRILWKRKESDEWKRADIDDLIRAYEDSERTGDWISLFDGNEWFVHCSKCKAQHYEEDLLMGDSELPNFCPNCGAKMKGGTE